MLSIRFTKEIDFPDDFKRLVDRNAKGFVEKDGIIEPNWDAEPWISPLILMKVIASEDSTSRDLRYDWQLESYSGVLLKIRINWATPMKVSQSIKPDKLYIELRI